MRLLHFTIAVALAMVLSGPVHGNSQTLDGLTPAVETVCDGYTGDAFGVCNAYCEAQDCNLQPDKQSCKVLLARFQKITSEKTPPCHVCGDGLVNNPAEECDDGNNTACDGCSPKCRLEKCGDGTVCPTEECDDGNNSACDGCSPVCTREYCGDGLQCPGEECEPGTNCDSGPCSNECLCPVIPDCPCGSSCSTADGQQGVCKDTDGNGSCECTQNPNPECQPATCSTFVPCTGSGCGAPVCGSTTEGGGVCVEGATPCAGLADCTTSADCSAGLCLMQTCCGRNVCVPTTAFCR